VSAKVVFLDFDGVLNCKEFFLLSMVERRSHREEEDRDGDRAWELLREASALDPVLIARLNRLLAVTGAAVVVSSSWRHGRTPEELREILGLRGFVGEVYGKTADYNGSWEQRGDEIRDWLKEHPEVTTYVVLDDDADMDAVRDRFIQTDMDGGGLLDTHVEQAILMLGGDDGTTASGGGRDG
jgi:hypothetical protein